MESNVALGKVLSGMVNAVMFHFRGERELNRHFADLRRASDEVEKSKVELDRAIGEARDGDQFQIFAEGARKSRF